MIEQQTAGSSILSSRFVCAARKDCAHVALSLGCCWLLQGIAYAQVLCKRLRLAGELDFKAVAAKTPGFVGADLRALTKEAAASAIQRIFHQPSRQTASTGMSEDILE